MVTSWGSSTPEKQRSDQVDLIVLFGFGWMSECHLEATPVGIAGSGRRVARPRPAGRYQPIPRLPRWVSPWSVSPGPGRTPEYLSPSQVDTLLRSVSTNLTAAPPIEWIATLTQELTWARQANRDLTDEVTGLRDDLDAARRALRRMIKNTATDPHG